MRRRSSVLAVVLAAVLGAGAADLGSLARSTCRVHRYFEELKTSNASIGSVERLFLSVILAQTSEDAD
jgi:hypothetical protein